MALNTIYEKFRKSVGLLYLFQNSTKEQFKKEISHLFEQSKVISKNPELQEIPSSLNRSLFRSIFDGQWHCNYSFERSISDLIRDSYIRKNKQFLWLFAEAYELYEDFLEESYAYAGYVDNEIWQLGDFGSISLSEIETKEYSWFRNKVAGKRDIPSSILNQFRKKLLLFSKIETDNALGVDFRLALSLAEHLRHVIVHLGGVVNDKSKFIDGVLKKCGYTNNGNYKQEHLDIINRCFGGGDFENHIWILEVRIMENIPLDIHVDPFQVMVEELLSHANLIFTLLDREDIRSEFVY